MDDNTSEDSQSQGLGIIEVIAIGGAYIFLIFTFPITIFFCFRVVTEYERLVVFRLGRIKDAHPKGPGMYFLLPCVDESRKVDIRTVSFDVPPQDVLSRDSVTVSVDAVIYYRVEDPLNAVIKVANCSSSTRLLAMTTLRNMLGTKNLSELLSDRETISSNMKVLLDKATSEWGVKIERVEIKDVCLPARLQRAMATEAEAVREAKAKVITAEGEMKVSQALKLASETIQDNPTALQLRYLQTLSTISTERNSTIIFPVPLEFLTGFVSKSSKKILWKRFKKNLPVKKDEYS